MDYFHNDTECLTVAGFSLENGIGSISMHGSITIGADESSLQALRALARRLAEMEKALVDAIEEGLSPRTSTTPPDVVDNPFS